MRILYITNRIDAAAGLERVLSIKASALADDFNHEVHIITLNQGNKTLFYDFSAKIKYHDINVKGNSMLYLFNYITHIKRVVKKINPDCISVCDDGLKGFYIPLILGCKYPIIYERHASKYISKNSDEINILQRLKLKILNYLMLFGAKYFDRFVVLTSNNLKEWKLNNLMVIPNPLSFYPETVSTCANKKVIAVGSHYFQKGFDILLKIWKQVSIHFPEWELVIYGKIDQNETYLKLAKTLELEKSVNFYEPVKNIADKYNEASIYTMTSRSEGFGMVLIEAMACGVPCIAFDCPSGPKDIITNNKDGYLIKNLDMETYTNNLKMLMGDEALRIKMGKSARVKAETYLPNAIILQWHNLFTNLTKPKK